MAVAQHLGALGHHHLLPVRIGGFTRATTRTPELSQLFPERVVEAQRPAEEGRDGGPRAIVRCGTQSAGGDDGAGASQRIAHRRGDLTGIITHRGPSDDRHADGPELARQPDRVGVDGQPQQQLIADGDDLDVHGREQRAEGGRQMSEGRGRKAEVGIVRRRVPEVSPSTVPILPSPFSPPPSHAQFTRCASAGRTSMPP